MTMTLSLRLRLLLLLAAALSVAFTLVHVAISAYTEVTLERVERRAARRMLQEWPHTDAAVNPGVTLQDTSASSRGCWPSLKHHTATIPEQGEQSAPLSKDLHGLLRTLCLSEEAPTTAKFTYNNQVYFAACARYQEQICGLALRPLVEDAGALGRLSLFYLSLIAASLLIAVYFALTYWVVSPLGQISVAAQRVSGGGHALTLPTFSVSELRELARHIVAMTQRLAAEQAQLSSKVTELTLARERLVQAQSQLVRSERLASVGQLSAGRARFSAAGAS
jgi:nitrate/nitrite-specific signal transduction histidine kinase